MTFAIGWSPTMSSLDFDNYWQILHSAMNTLLTLSPGEYPPISYEVTHSAVYKCVCNGYAEDLYRKLMQAVTIHLETETRRLQARFYVEAKLNLSLKQELVKLFDRIVMESNLERLLILLSNPPVYVSPSVFESIVKGIHELRPECANQYPAIFQKIIPGLVGVTIDQLPDLQIEARAMMNRAAEVEMNAASSSDENYQHNNLRGIKRERTEFDDSDSSKHFRQN